MQSTNFEFLRKTPDFAVLADLAGFAETYAHPDPVSALVKLRTFGETLTLALYDSVDPDAAILGFATVDFDADLTN